MKCSKCSSNMNKIDAWRYICSDCNYKITKCEIYSRVVGYIRPVDQFNDGKQEEFKDRKLFDISEKQTFI